MIYRTASQATFATSTNSATVSFETPAIIPGRIYQVRGTCCFFEDATENLQTLNWDTLLLALGCVKRHPLEDCEAVLGCQFVFKFLWNEMVVNLPLTCMTTYREGEHQKLHEDLEQSLGLFVRLVEKKPNVNAEQT